MNSPGICRMNWEEYLHVGHRIGRSLSDGLFVHLWRNEVRESRMGRGGVLKLGRGQRQRQKMHFVEKQLEKGEV